MISGGAINEDSCEWPTRDLAGDQGIEGCSGFSSTSSLVSKLRFELEELTIGRSHKNVLGGKS